MLSGIGSWRWHENSGRFVGSRLHKELEAQSCPQPLSRKALRGPVLRVSKRYAVGRIYAFHRQAISHHRRYRRMLASVSS